MATLQEILKKASKSFANEAKQFVNQVRELEEESKGTFIAFVDDGKESRDVKFTIDPKTLELKEYSCDCKEYHKRICVHVFSVIDKLVNHPGKGKSYNLGSEKTKGRKRTTTSKMLESLEEYEILQWLENELKNNKELALKFKNHFIVKGVITLDILKENFTQARKSVLGRKKHFELSEVKRILELLKPIHDRVLDQALPHFWKKENVMLIDQVLLELFHIAEYCNKSTPRISTYANKIFEKISLSFNVLKDQRKIELLNNVIAEPSSKVLFFQFLGHIIIDLAEVMDKNEQMHLIKGMLNSKELGLTKDEVHLSDTLNLVFELGILSDLKDYFSPKEYFEDYNSELCELLMESEEYEYVLKNADKIIDLDTSYSLLDFYEFKTKALIALGMEKEAKELLIKSFKEYKDVELLTSLIEMNCTQKELKPLFEIVEAIQLKPNSFDYQSNLFVKFYYYHHTKQYDIMLQKMKGLASYFVAREYMDELISENKFAFGRKMIEAVNDSRYDNQKLVELIITDFITLLDNHFSNSEARKLISSKKFYDSGLQKDIVEKYFV